MNYRHTLRVLDDPNAVLKGVADTEKERKFGNVIRVAEQPDFFALLKEEMGLEGRAREKFEWALHSRNIGTTLRRAQEHAKGGSQKQSEDEKEKGDDGKPPSPKGFFRTMLGL